MSGTHSALVMDVLTEVQRIGQSSNPYKTSVTAGLCGHIKPGMLRSVYWKIFLGLLSAPRSKCSSVLSLLEQWEEATHEQRKLYTAKRKSSAGAKDAVVPAASPPAKAQKKKTRFGDSDDDEDDTEAIKKDNPLSSDTSSSYAKEFQRKKLEETIEKDMGRLWSDDPFFDDESVRHNMKTILMDFCDEERCADDDTHIPGYRQGMHEVLSLIYYVVHRDAETVSSLKPKLSDLTESQEDELSVLSAICSPTAVLQDSYMIFARVMSSRDGLGLLPWYHGNVGSPKAVSPATATAPNGEFSPVGANAVADVAHTIQHVLLRQCDEQLCRKLTKELDVQPTSYLLRWLRLLFLREFSFSQSCIIWDAIFAEFSWRRCEEDEEAPYQLHDSIVPYVATSMLLFIGNDLMQCDFSFALRRLMRYPPVEDARPIIAKAIDMKHRGSRIALIAGVFPGSTAAAAVSPAVAASSITAPSSCASPPAVSPTSGPGTATAHLLPPPVSMAGVNSSGAPAPAAGAGGPWDDPTGKKGNGAHGTVVSPSTGLGAPPPLAVSFGGGAVVAPRRGSGFEVETVASLRDRQIRQGMVLTSVIRRLEAKWFAEPAQSEEQKAKLEEDYVVAIAELKKVRDVLLNSVSE